MYKITANHRAETQILRIRDQIFPYVQHNNEDRNFPSLTDK